MDLLGLRQRERDHADAWHLLGTLEIERGNLDSAHTLLSRALAVGPETAPFHNNLAYLFSRTNRPKLAERAYKQGIAELRKLRQAFPGFPTHRQELAVKTPNTD